MIEKTINKVIKSISNLTADYKIALIRILTGIVNNIILLDKGKVDKEEGKDLSTNDFTDELKNKLENFNIDLMTEITWSELKSLRDGKKLTPGMQYRITDYQCTTTQDDNNIQSANHPFDIIVTADDINKLNENARACLHKDDTYFAVTKFESWKLKYKLDNDTIHFDWADSQNGKGIIYWMKDEWDNECPYDFKNIQFNYGSKWMYTFTDATNNNIVDGSIQGYVNDIINNKIKSRYYSKYKIPINIFNRGCYDNILGNNCYGNYFDYDSRYNVLENNCANNKFSDSCSFNHLGYGCVNNIFSSFCQNNILKQYCSSNNFGSNCNKNILYISCRNNKFNSYCDFNILYNDCHDNTFLDSCKDNILYNECYSNSFYSYCRYNILKARCSGINMKKSYIWYIIVESNNTRIEITSTQTTSSSNKLQNFKIAQCFSTGNPSKTISHDTVNDAFQTIYKPTGSTEIEA